MSSTRYLALAFVLTVSITLNAADCKLCDCTHWPWKDACEKCCSLSVINNSSNGELRQFLKLGQGSLQKLYTLREKGPISSVDDLQKTIGPSQTDQIFQQIQALTPLEKQYLISPPAQKGKLRDKMEAAGGPGAPPPS
jgi:hypothetical protein